ncbi:MAG: hypothetical protein HC886_10630 [Leptolyngbyaceae cyanobacterium SM1_1_3]|nr:hypothetical protein [Leptolyngbyaceae cyanobacterium SM1_1_3]NJN03598.1 hypothetical protein [Leptolyngbyaceae cyanobacterium RM1_1_2]NJO09453.1 hypothetical protein [Leptolyngbyaceae cyanobacterium SL_1_1]
MSQDDPIKQRLNLEIEGMSVNQLTELGNQAIQMGLIAGHGYRRGQYEILRQGKVVLLPPQEALIYLQDLVRSISE